MTKSNEGNQVVVLVLTELELVVVGYILRQSAKKGEYLPTEGDPAIRMIQAEAALSAARKIHKAINELPFPQKPDSKNEG